MLFEPSFLEKILAVPLNDPVSHVIATAKLDRSLRRSLAAIVQAISAAEAQVNEWAADRGGWIGKEDNETLVKKLRLVARKHGKDSLSPLSAQFCMSWLTFPLVRDLKRSTMHTIR